MLATRAGCVNLFAIDSIDTSVRSVIFGRRLDVEGSMISLLAFFWHPIIDLLSIRGRENFAFIPFFYR